MSTKTIVPLWHRVTLRDYEVAELLGISKSTWRDLYRHRDTPWPVRLRGCTLWFRAEVEAWLLAGCPSGAAWVWRPRVKEFAALNRDRTEPDER